MKQYSIQQRTLTQYIHTICTLCLVFAGVITVSSCRKDLCYEPYHPHTQDLEVVVDRTLMNNNLSPVRLMFYPVSDLGIQSGAPLVRFVDMNINTVQIPNGLYNIIACNDNTEIVSFRADESYTAYEAYLNTVTRGGSFAQSASSTTKEISLPTVEQPDMLYAVGVEKFPTGSVATLLIAPASCVFTLRIIIEVEGIERVAFARGSLLGVSPSVLLYNRMPIQDKPAEVFYDGTITNSAITTSVNVFGFTNVVLQDDHKQILNLELMLKDKQIITYTVDITRHITSDMQINGGIITLYGDKENILIPPLKPTDGGFNPDIGDWDDEQIIPIR
jgi:Domain of unknown function (DUF5119)